MKKIKDFCYREYKVLIPVMVVVMLLIVLLFFYKEYQYDNYRNKKDIPVFQYFAGLKTEYTAQVTYNLKDSIVDIKAKDAKIEYDGTPIYYKDEQKVLFPKEMTIIFPLREASQYKLYKYATYYKEDNLHFIKNNTDIGEYSFFFLYDGKGVFFFPYEVELKQNNKLIKKLSPMSTVSVVGGATLTYHDFESDTADFKEIEGDTITVTSDNMLVNLTEKYIEVFGKEILLFTPNKLSPVFK